jgi:hypothetical protein
MEHVAGDEWLDDQAASFERQHYVGAGQRRPDRHRAMVNAAATVGSHNP